MFKIRTFGGEKLQIEVDFYTDLARLNDTQQTSKSFITEIGLWLLDNWLQF